MVNILQLISLGIGVGFGLHSLFSLLGYSIYSLIQIAKS